LKPDVVILAGDWTQLGSAREVGEGLDETMKYLASSKVIVVGQGPVFAMPVVLLIPDEMFEEKTVPSEITVEDRFRNFNAEIAASAQRHGFEFLDLHDHLCARERCDVVREGKLMIWDQGGHLTIEGSKSVAPHIMKRLPAP
jgi:hypothetical protein